MPKGAVLTHRNMVNNAQLLNSLIGMSIKDRILLQVPLYHCFGMVMGLMTASFTGTSVILPNDYFNAQKSLICAEKYRATLVYGVPTMYISLINL